MKNIFSIALAILTFNPLSAFSTPNCESLGRYECRNSSECSLDCERGYGDDRCTSNYFCRPKTGRCEKGLVQGNFDKEACLARKGCVHVGSCYCPCEEASEEAAKRAGMRPCNCACGHGLPQNCEEAEKENKKEFRAQKFLTKTTLKTISDSPELYIDSLRAMMMSPMYIPPNRVRVNAVKISSESRALVEKALAGSLQIDPEVRLSTCKYEPGLKLSFSKNSEESIALLICFNCDVWALGKEDLRAPNNDNRVAAYGDLRPYRKELIRIAKEAFPSDPTFSNLK